MVKKPNLLTKEGYMFNICFWTYVGQTSLNGDRDSAFSSSRLSIPNIAGIFFMIDVAKYSIKS